jgi:hypothetical protein
MFGGKTGEEPYQSTDYVSARCIIMFIEANQAGDLLASFIGAEIWSPPLALKSLITIWVEGFFYPQFAIKKIAVHRGIHSHLIPSTFRNFSTIYAIRNSFAEISPFVRFTCVNFSAFKNFS